MPRSATAVCSNCHSVLERTAGRSITATLALSCGVLVLLAATYTLPVLSVHLAGSQRETYITSAFTLLIQNGWAPVAIFLGAFLVVLPIVRFSLLTLTLSIVRFGGRPSWLGPAFRFAIALDLWSMLDVLLIGGIVGYVRLAQNLNPTIESGGWCFAVVAMLTMITSASLDRRTVWRQITPDGPAPKQGRIISCTVCDLTLPASMDGERCPRCLARLHARKPDAVIRAVALTLAGLLLYAPANLLPMTTVTQLGQTEGQTITYGVNKLFQVGLWPLGIVVFCTSILIPLFKLLAMGWFVLSVRYRWRWGLEARTRLHRIMDDLGRWSNVDVMIIIVFAPLMQFGQLATAHFAVGGACFFAVVIVTMLASRSFDPRLMWDAVEIAK